MTTQDKASQQGVTLREALPEINPHSHPEPRSFKWTENEIDWIKEYAYQFAKKVLSQPPAPEQASGGPAGDFAVVPLKLTREMELYLMEDDWDWPELLAIAGTVTEEKCDRASELAATPTAEPGGEAPLDTLRRQIKEVTEAAYKTPGVAVKMPDLVVTEGRKFMRGEPSLFDQLPFAEVQTIGSTLGSASPAAPEDGPLPNEPKPCLMCDPSVGVFCDEHAAPVSAKPEPKFTQPSDDEIWGDDDMMGSSS